MAQGQVFLQGREGGGTFPIKFFQDLSFLHSEITLLFAKLCYAFEEKLFFSTTIFLLKKVILSCLKMNLKISLQLRFDIFLNQGRLVGDWIRTQGCCESGEPSKVL